MDAAQAIADLTEISSQVEHVAVMGSDGAVAASTFADDERAAAFAAGVARLVAEADGVREQRGLPGLAQLEAATLGGSVFVVRDGNRTIAATTKPDPTVGLVFYDLKHALRSIDDAPEPKKRAPRKKKAESDAAA